MKIHIKHYFHILYRQFLYPIPGKPLEIRQIDGQYEVFTLVEKTIKQQLTTLINEAPKVSVPCESLLAGSMALALCYITRVNFYNEFSIINNKIFNF